MLFIGDVTYIKKRSRWQSKLSMNSPVIEGSIDGYVETGDKSGLVSSRVEVEYTLEPQNRRSKQERFTVNNKWRYNTKQHQYSLIT